MHDIQAWFQKSNPFGLLLLGLIVGIGGAISSAIFHSLIYLSTLAFYGYDGSIGFISLVETIPTWKRLLIPTLGGLLVGIIFAIAKVSEAEGEGVPEVMEALTHKRGTIRPIVAPIKIITAALTLGSGGSAGREGPVIQIGSAIGSTIAQTMKLASAERSLLLAAGAAAAIGGTFGAPVAGVLFSIEILHHKSKGFLRAFVLVLAAFTGMIGTRLMTGHEGLRFSLSPTLELDVVLCISLIALGVLSAFTALLFGVFLVHLRTLFKKISLPHLLKPAIGGFIIGCIGLYLPYIHEPAAYPLMVQLIDMVTLPLGALLVLLVLKMLATGITLGSGGSGGIFAPLLLMGAVVGSIFASILLLFGFITTSTAPLLIVLGMAGVFAGAAHAPLTASFITYEMTGDIRFLIPLLLVCFIATFIAKKITHKSVYHHEGV
jgi:chloride channel protein, CIC family